jgi:hypothetical protein
VSDPAKTVGVVEAVKAMAASAPRQSFSFTLEGAFSFSGYSAAEVETLLKIYRDHLTSMAEMAEDHPIPSHLMTGGGYQ